MIKLKNVTKTYGDKLAVNDVSLELPSKGIYFIVGKSGSGKSALLNLIGGLDKPTSGEIVINGINTSSFSEKERDDYRNANIGFIFQKCYLQDNFSVKENLLLPLELQSKHFNKKEKVEDALKSVGLSGFEKRTVYTLLDEEKQRVSIARAIIKDPLMVLADEPTGMLDGKSGNQIFKILQTIAETKLVLVISHDLVLAKEYGNGIIELADGKIVANNLKPSLEIPSQKQEPAKQKRRISLREALLFARHHLHEKPLRLCLSVLLSVASLGLFGLFDSLSSIDKLDIAANSLVSSENTHLSIGNRSLEHPLLSDDDIANVKDETGLAFSGVTRFEDYVNMLNYAPAPFQEYYLRFFDGNIKNCLGYSDVISLPKSFSILAGDYPKNDNEIMLTDFQYEFFHKFGFFDKSSGKALDPINEPKDLLGKSLACDSAYLRFTNKICGIIDTDFDMAHFQSYMDFVEYCKFSEEAANESIQKLKDELEEKKNCSYFNVAIVSQNIIETVKKKADSRIFELKAGLGKLLFDYLSPYSSLNTPRCVNCFGDGISKTTAYFSNDDSWQENSLVVKVGEYIETLVRLDKLDSLIAVTIPKKFIFNSDNDQTFSGFTTDFFNLFPSYGISYITDKHYSEAFENNLFNEKQYAKMYYGFKQQAEPEVIPEADKKEIFRLYAIHVFYDRSADDEYADALYDEGNQIAQSMLQHFVSFYKDTIFSYRNLHAFYQADFSNDEKKKIDFVLIGLSYTYDMVISPNLAKKICFDVGGYYSWGIIPMPKETSGVEKLLRVNYESQGADSGINVKGPLPNSITSLTDSLFIYKAIFLPIAIASALCSFFLLFSYFSILATDKRKEIGILRTLGAKKSDVISIFLMESLIISMVCFGLSLLVLFIAAPQINRALMASTGVLVTIFTPGARQIFILLGISLLISFCSALFPIRKISKITPISAIRP